MKLANKLILVIIFFSFAQILISQNQPLQLTAAIRTEVVDSLSKSLLKNYIFLDTAIKMCNYIEKRLKDGSYNAIVKPNEFAQKLTTDLRAIYNDVHLSITFAPQMQQTIPDSKMNAAEKRQQNLAQYRQQNFGFKKLEILSGNIGYVSFDQFYGFNDFSKEVVNIAFSFLKNADALIIDLRNNGGGSPDMVTYICSFLLPASTQLSSFYERRTNQTETAHTYQPSVPVSFVGKPIYVLVSRRSFSGAEAFSYDLQALHKATIIGETTGGGAHAVEPKNVSNGFTALLPYSKAINPITGTNWEAVGVKPDIEINADSALDAAVLSYYDYQITNLNDSKKVSSIKWARDMLNAKLHPLYIDTTILKMYVGNFADRIVSIKDGGLYYKGKDGKESKLIALSPSIFKLDNIDYMKMAFLKNMDEKVIAVDFIFEDGFIANYQRKE